MHVSQRSWYSLLTKVMPSFRATFWTSWRGMNKEVLRPLQYRLVTCTPTVLRITTVSRGYMSSQSAKLIKQIFTFVYREDDCREQIGYDRKHGAPNDQDVAPTLKKIEASVCYVSSALIYCYQHEDSGRMPQEYSDRRFNH